MAEKVKRRDTLDDLAVGACEAMAYMRIQSLLDAAESDYDQCAFRHKSEAWARVRALRDAQALFATTIKPKQK